MAKEWDKENMKTLGANMKREDAEAFAEYAKANGTTVGALLRGFVQRVIAEEKTGSDYRGLIDGVKHVVSYKNTDLLKHEVAFHNPNHLNPDGMLNEILDEYFRFVKKVRK
ncbi:MAG: hypothetical protein IJP11_09275 [Oscillospiraceae bacterium]|nr:hypothetical protein [Oscillospiraceae bacterium]